MSPHVAWAVARIGVAAVWGLSGLALWYSRARHGTERVSYRARRKVRAAWTVSTLAFCTVSLVWALYGA